jgi:hypothetical protein
MCRFDTFRDGGDVSPGCDTLLSTRLVAGEEHGHSECWNAACSSRYRYSVKIEKCKDKDGFPPL